MNVTFYCRIFETVLIAIVTTFSVFILATFFGTCVPHIDHVNSKDFVNSTRNYFCPTSGLLTKFGTDYFTEYFNDIATLVFNSEEDAIKQLFHQNGKSISCIHL